MDNSTFTCNGCSISKPSSEFHADRSKKTGHATICKACVSARQKAMRKNNPEKYQQDLARMRIYTARPEYMAKRKAEYALAKLRIVELYGGKCACCGESEPLFLTLDHIDGTGAEHRAQDSQAYTMVRWHMRRKFAKDDRLQLLCWNCNCAKGVYGSCPHADQQYSTG